MLRFAATSLNGTIYSVSLQPPVWAQCACIAFDRSRRCDEYVPNQANFVFVSCLFITRAESTIHSPNESSRKETLFHFNISTKSRELEFNFADENSRETHGVTKEKHRIHTVINGNEIFLGDSLSQSLVFNVLNCHINHNVNPFEWKNIERENGS